MTAAQTAARARFKKAVKIAADIRKKNPKLTQAEAVKKAFATIGAPAKKAAVKKKAAPAKKSAVKKKAAPKKKAVKKSCVTDHRDSKSHNVNIRVVSGYKSRNPYITEKKLSEVRKNFNPDAIERKYTLTELKKMNPTYFSNRKKDNQKYKLVYLIKGFGKKVQYLLEKLITKNHLGKKVTRYFATPIGTFGTINTPEIMEFKLSEFQKKIGKKVTF